MIGWRKKVDVLKMTLLSAGWQTAKPIAPNMEHMLEMYREFARTLDVSIVTGFAEAQKSMSTDPTVLHEPASILGWDLTAAFVLRNTTLWWVVHAWREKPSDLRRVDMLYQVIERLGGDRAHQVVGPECRPEGVNFLPFGWWTWPNTEQLYEIQVDKNRKGKHMMRIVRSGERASDGYEKIDLVPPEPE